jgi:hypothetical protein
VTVRTYARIVGGAAAGVLLWGVAVQPLASELRLPPRPNVACDSLNEATVTSVQMDEGFARATYTTCGARLTSNEPVSAAPWIAILGDSYVEARQVADGETVGARLERISRDAGKPVNVRQYGWAGAPPAQYVAVAPLFKNRYLSRAVILLSADDFGPDTTLPMPWVDAATSPAQPSGSLALTTLVQRRWSLIVERSPSLVRRVAGATSGSPPAPEAEIPKPTMATAVRALQGAFGERLLLVFLSSVLSADSHLSASEEWFLAECKRRGVQCIGLHGAMLDMLRDQGRLARGFSNTTIGVGHLNADGHDLLAREIWKALR